MASDDYKFTVGGEPPARLLRGKSKYMRLYAALDEIEIGVWARTTLADEEAAQRALQAVWCYG